MGAELSAQSPTPKSHGLRCRGKKSQHLLALGLSADAVIPKQLILHISQFDVLPIYSTRYFTGADQGEFDIQEYNSE